MNDDPKTTANEANEGLAETPGTPAQENLEREVEEGVRENVGQDTEKSEDPKPAEESGDESATPHNPEAPADRQGDGVLSGEVPAGTNQDNA